MRAPGRLRVAFLGPRGTFSEEALRASAPARVDGVPYPTVWDTVMAVQERAVDRAVVPIENSLEGGVAATLDALATEADAVRIAGEVVLPVRHCVIAAREMPLEAVTRMFSHPQATGQCARFLRERLRHTERIDVGSTAEAVRIVQTLIGSNVALSASTRPVEVPRCSGRARGSAPAGAGSTSPASISWVRAARAATARGQCSGRLQAD